jgi:hypothetical protein
MDHGRTFTHQNYSYVRCEFADYCFCFSCSNFICWCSGSAAKSKGFKALVGLQHLSLTLIIVTGAILVVMKNFEVRLGFMPK